MTEKDEYHRQIDLCAKCGACVPVCPLFRLTGRESMAARGKLHLLGKIDPGGASEGFADIFSHCLQCGACRQECPREIDIPSLVSCAREQLKDSLQPSSLAQTVLLQGMKHQLLSFLLGSSCRSISSALSGLLPADSGLRIKLSLPHSSSTLNSAGRQALPSYPALSSQPSTADPGTVALFGGCYARHLHTDIEKATKLLLTKYLQQTTDFPEKQSCCGLAFLSSGKRQEARELARRNIAAFEGSDWPVVTPCSSCFSHLRSYPALFADDRQWLPRAERFAARLIELSTFLDSHGLGERLSAISSQETVYYHDSCHLRLHQKITLPPRRLLASVVGLRLVENEDGYQCCGAGGLFGLHHPDLATDMCSNLLQSVDRMAARRVVTSCSGCLLQIHQGCFGQGRELPVQHLAVFLTELLIKNECP